MNMQMRDPVAVDDRVDVFGPHGSQRPRRASGCRPDGRGLLIGEVSKAGGMPDRLDEQEPAVDVRPCRVVTHVDQVRSEDLDRGVRCSVFGANQAPGWRHAREYRGRAGTK